MRSAANFLRSAMNGTAHSSSSSSSSSLPAEKAKVNGKQTRAVSGNGMAHIQEQDPDFEKEMSEKGMLVDESDQMESSEGQQDKSDSQAESSSGDASSDEESSDEDSSDSSTSTSTSSDSNSDSESDDSTRRGSRAKAKAGGLDFAHLESLAASAAASMRARAEAKKLASRKEFEDGDDVISFGSEPQQQVASKLAKSSGKSSGGSSRLMPEKGKGKSTAASTSSKGIRKDMRKNVTDRSLDQLSTGQLIAADAPKTGRGARRDRQIERSKTSGSKWFHMPAFPAAAKGSSSSTSDPSSLLKGGASVIAGDARQKTALELRREIMAMRLRNSMDPKRFYRGNNKSAKVALPAFAQLGTILPGNTDRHVLKRDERGRSVVEELLRDSQSRDYAKKKFGEVQAKNTPTGRLKHKYKKGGKGKKVARGGRR